VTAREEQDRRRKRILALGGVGAAMLLAAAAAGSSAGDSALLLAIAGSLVLFVAVFQLAIGTRCPRCQESLGGARSWTARRCPHCGLRLDAEDPRRAGPR